MMVTINKSAHKYPNDPLRNPQVGVGHFNEAFFFMGDRRDHVLAPDSHPIDSALIAATDYLYELFAEKYGELARPYNSSSYRTTATHPGFSSSSLHFKGMAIDLNWVDANVEAEIVQVMDADWQSEGPISQELKRIGIRGLGTYYEQEEGTFIHLDTRTSGYSHFRKLSPMRLVDANELYMSFVSQYMSGGEPIEVPYKPVTVPVYSSLDPVIDMVTVLASPEDTTMLQRIKAAAKLLTIIALLILAILAAKRAAL